MKTPSTDWDFSAEAEIAFDDWFNGDYGPYTLRSEYFYGDCAEEDLKTLEKSMYQWLHVSFVTGYERGVAQQTKFKPLPDSQRLRIMQQVAVTSAIEGQGEVYDIFAQLLYNYLTDKKFEVTLCDETKV